MGAAYVKQDSKKNKSEEPNTPRSKQWRELQREDKEKWGNQMADHYKTALSIENVDKNRYNSVLAPDSSRVVLKSKQNNIQTSDYINANFVNGVHKDSDNSYIATQAPTLETIEDFWRMCWEVNTKIIVMLTNLEEDGRVKAHQYWPTIGTKNFGSWCVTLLSTTSSDNEAYQIRVLELKQGSGTGKVLTQTKITDKEDNDVEKRVIYQYHYQIWPDHGVPSDPKTVLDMMEDVNTTFQKLVQDGPSFPLLVHCSAGIGRTGSYVVIDSVIKKFKEENTTEVDELDLQPIVSTMRNQRPGFVQQKAQYLFCYQTISLAITGTDNFAPTPSKSDSTKKRKKEAKPKKAKDKEEKSED
uniref:Protein-tyrosine-phosphatase n=1 Tax=Arcella intermedia TaxID=1963864 RepID=A0A6B2L7Q4_9EUKA